MTTASWRIFSTFIGEIPVVAIPTDVQFTMIDASPSASCIADIDFACIALWMRSDEFNCSFNVIQRTIHHPHACPSAHERESNGSSGASGPQHNRMCTRNYRVTLSDESITAPVAICVEPVGVTIVDSYRIHCTQGLCNWVYFIKRINDCFF